MRNEISNEQVLLAIGWRDGKRYKLGRVDTERPVTEHLRSLALRQEQKLEASTPRSYSVESTLEEDEYFVATTVLPDEEDALRRQLLSIGGLPLITVDRLEASSLSFYAVIVSATDGVKAYIKKSNPLIVAKAGGLLALFGDSLTHLEKPVFTIAETFDLVLYPDRIAIMREKPFTSLFYEETGINAKIIGWVDEIALHLPMHVNTKATLTRLCQKGLRLRLKLQAIEERGHLSNLTMAKFRKELQRLGIPANRFISGGKIVIPGAYERQLLEVLNEDLFRGGFSGDDFAAERKTKTSVA
jgi:hypothetical protein